MIKPGDTVTRIWGNGYLETEMRVVKIDDKFIYCDMRVGEEVPGKLPLRDDEYWKFDRGYGVETDEQQGWGIEPYGRNIVLTRIVEKKEG